jgi:outer membrane protein assembly factor BamE (lipoprotein component of BamABCDE complex)
LSLNLYKMRYSILLYLILFIFPLSGCQTTQTYKPPTFSTFFGDIEKGYSMADVMEVLGNPNDIYISPTDNSELWYYDSTEETVVVYFLSKKVLKVIVNEDAFETALGDIKRGAHKLRVVEMLGQPYQKSLSKNREIWCYRLGEEDVLLVFFRGDNVTTVWKKNAGEER